MAGQIQTGRRAVSRASLPLPCLCCEVPLSWLLALCAAGNLTVLQEGQELNGPGWEGSTESLWVLFLLQCRVL